MNEWNNMYVGIGDCDLGECTLVTTFDVDRNGYNTCKVYKNNPEGEEPITYNYDFYIVDGNGIYFGKYGDE